MKKETKKDKRPLDPLSSRQIRLFLYLAVAFSIGYIICDYKSDIAAIIKWCVFVCCIALSCILGLGVERKTRQPIKKSKKKLNRIKKVACIMHFVKRQLITPLHG